MIFLDSSFLVSLEVESDQNHKKAVNIKEEIKEGKYGQPIISDYVFDETVTVTFGRTKNLKKAILVGENLRKSSKMMGVDKDLFEKSWILFTEQKRTKLSFTDCSILACMEKENAENLPHLIKIL